jgi:P27 family predicted phage terminase small subunit
MKAEVKIKNELIKLLKQKNLYEETDLYLVDELVFNLIMIEDIKKQLGAQGLMMNIVRKPGAPEYYQKNPIFGIYDTTLKNIKALFQSLGIAPADRAKFKLTTPETDEFDELF